MDPRAERIGRNEVLFRDVNERLRDVGESFSLVAERGDFVCECGDLTCAEPVRMPLAEYERIRSHPTWLFVVPGHESPDLESVIESHGGYDIIAKHPGDPAELAAAEDPRG